MADSGFLCCCAMALSLALEPFIGGRDVVATGLIAFLPKEIEHRNSETDSKKFPSPIRHLVASHGITLHTQYSALGPAHRTDLC